MIESVFNFYLKIANTNTKANEQLFQCNVMRKGKKNEYSFILKIPTLKGQITFGVDSIKIKSMKNFVKDL